MKDFFARIEDQHAAEVKAGEHDASCEFMRTPGFYLCHCSKRRRQARGLTVVPELEFVPPTCLGCGEETEVVDGFACPRCCVSWDYNGSGGTFTDDYGDLDEEPPSVRIDRELAERQAAEPPAVIDVHLPETDEEASWFAHELLADRTQDAAS